MQMRIVYHNPETNHMLTVADNGNSTFMELFLELNEKIRMDNAMTTEHNPNGRLAEARSHVVEAAALAEALAGRLENDAEALGDVWEAVDALLRALTRLEGPAGGLG
jgi:hypothetical protein